MDYKHQEPECLPGPSGGNDHASGKNLSTTELGGAIFGCKHNTMGECLTKKLFGLPFPHFNFVKNIEPGLTLFLFNYSDRKMYGIYEASSPGDLNIDPYAWTNGSKEKTNFPAQVRIHARMQCQPITEQQFKSVIGDNYYSHQKFWFELNHAQTEGLIALFLASVLSINARTPPLVRRHGSGCATSMITALEKEIGGTHSYIDSPKEGYLGISLASTERHFCSEDLESEEAEVHVIRKPSIYSNCLIDFHTPYVPNDINEGSMLPGNPFVSVARENVIASDPFKRKIELMDTLEVLKARAAALESKQFESESRMEELRNMVMDSDVEIQQLNYSVKELESRLIQLASSEGIIFLIGGYDGKSWLSSLDSFSPSMDVLLPLKPMGSIRSYASTAALNDKIYVFGGGDGKSCFCTVECYSPRNANWTLCSPLAREKGSLAGATLNDKIYALGGGNGSECFSDVEMFDPSIGKWIYNQSMLQKRYAPAAAVLHDVLYATGGFDGRDYLQTVEILDPRIGYWTKVPDMNIKRGNHSMAVFNDKLYVMGGFDGEKVISNVEYFDSRNQSWIEVAPLNYARRYLNAAVLGGTLFIMGGHDDDYNIIETVECFSELTGWVNCTNKAIGKRTFFSAIVP